MRALLGLLVLGVLFAMAAAWQGRWMENLKGHRNRLRGRPVLQEHFTPGWSHLTIGRPSGVAPPPVEAAPPREDPRQEVVSAVVTPTPERGWVDAPLLPDFEYTVQTGDILGRIVREHYGPGASSLVQDLAKYNELTSPDAIRQGDVLYLPDRRVLE